jgi:hypothetical protein
VVLGAVVPDPLGGSGELVGGAATVDERLHGESLEE